MRTHIICRNWQDDRVIPRFARHLMDTHGWTVSAKAEPGADLNFYLGYFEYGKNRQFDQTPTASYLTHYEECDAGDAKRNLYDDAARAATWRIAMNKRQLPHLRKFGKAVVLPLPLELDFFKLKQSAPNARPVVGVAGYTYKSGRKGARLIEQLLKFNLPVDWQAAGRGWPLPTKMYPWAQMPAFFQGLDIFLNTSMVEGGPMSTLEALACGVPVVIPAEVGIHPDLPEIPGVYRYPRGNVKAMDRALREAIAEYARIDREALRAATQPHSVKAWTQGVARTFEHWLYDKPKVTALPDRQGKQGIYMVAFGDQARYCANICIPMIRKHMPDIPVALVSDRKLGPEHISIVAPDKDLGGRIAKLNVYDLAPKEWEYILYLDADTEVVANIEFFFQLLQDGWEYVICKDPHLHDTMKSFERRNNKVEYQRTINQLGTTEALQINGGVWAFRRCARTKAFFERWMDEWAVHKGRDQGAWMRAMYMNPLRIFWLGNEWNTLITAKGEEYPPGRAGTAGVLHFPMRARRWRGQVPAGHGLDDPVAWDMVLDFEQTHGADGRIKIRAKK